MKHAFPVLAAFLLLPQIILHGQDLNRCEILPLPSQEVSFRIDGLEKTRWHFGEQYPRPFFFPFTGPSGVSLTHMGHPGAPNHDHHRSVWFAHNDVEGVDFWSDQTKARIRQKTWLCYRDGKEEAVMASLLGWYDETGRERMEQELVAALIPMDKEEHALEFQITLRPPASQSSVELRKTNFGLLAVRVAKSLSVYFGGGKLTNSEGQEGEPANFGQPARWMDYSGSVAVGTGAARKPIIEGITYFDHPANPRYPTRWHVREDGWMGASLCLQEGFTVTTEQPLVLRYLLYAHAGPCDRAKADVIQNQFASRPGFKVEKATQRHHQFMVSRAKVSR